MIYLGEKFAFLKLHRWPCGLGHYYGEFMMDQQRTDIEVVLSNEDVDLFNEQEGLPYGASGALWYGVKSSRVHKRESLYPNAIALFNKLKKSHHLGIIIGDSSVAQAQEILYLNGEMEDSHTRNYKMALNELWAVVENHYNKTNDPWDKVDFRAAVNMWEVVFKQLCDYKEQK